MSSTVDISDGIVADKPADNEESVELPDDFFDEFEDSKFLDELVETVVPAQTPMIRKVEVEDANDTNDNDNSTETKNDRTEQEPTLKRCLDEIDNLSKSIKRRKQKLMRNDGNNKRKRDISQSPPTTYNSRSDRNVRSRGDRRSSPRRSTSRPKSVRRGRSRSRERNRSRSRERNRSRDQRRRDRSRSESPAHPSSRGMTFLEELARKFAEKGQEFPEKDRLMQLQGNGGLSMNHHPATIGYPPQCEVQQPMHMPPFMQMQSMQMSMYNQSYPMYWNGNGHGNYLIDHMPSSMQPMMHHQVPTRSSCVNDTMKANNVIQNANKTIDSKSPRNKDEVVARCRAASKILRGEDNKVPKLRFLFTRTSMPIATTGEAETPPLQSKKNVEFEQTADNQKPFAPLHFLPPRTRELVKILGFNCESILDRLRLKRFADKVINEIEDIDAETKRTKERSYRDGGMQTESYKCPSCLTKESKSFSNKAVGTDATKKVSIRCQTNERDYREPLIRTLSRMTPGQLVAVSDFIEILVNEPRPSTSTEIFSVREKLMDIYNLSERSTEAIEAERSREHQEPWRRGMNKNNVPMPSPPVEDLRSTIRGTSDHGVGRVPPPPPLIVNSYHMNGAGMIIDQEQQEREMRLQQMRYEENLRIQLQLEEQRNRELEWERQQQMIMQQRQVQLQLQLQREQEEENARMEMRNDRRNGFGRCNNQWNDGRGRY